MLEIFIVFFGCLYFGAKFFLDRRQTKAYDRKYESSRAAYRLGKAKWESQVVDSDLEDELSRKLKEEPLFYLSTIQEMKDYFGDMYIDRIKGYSPGSYSATALRYLLAKQGKLKLCDADDFGIGIVGAQKDSSIDMRRWEKEMNFIKWMDSELKKNGVKTELRFREGGIYPTAEKKLSEVKQYEGGDLYWINAAYSTY